MSKKGLGLQVLVNYKLLPDLQSLNLCKFYIFVGYSDEVKGCRLWDPTSHKIITRRDMYMEQSEVVQDHKGRFVCKLKESLYGLKVPRKWYKMFYSFMMKDLGATKQILGIEVHRDGKNGKLWLSQQSLW
jgi:hypothetical protein